MKHSRSHLKSTASHMSYVHTRVMIVKSQPHQQASLSKIRLNTVLQIPIKIILFYHMVNQLNSWYTSNQIY